MIGLTQLILAIEIAAVVDAAVVAEGDVETGGGLLNDRPHARILMNVLVRIEMRGRAIGEAEKCIELMLNFQTDGGGIIEVNDFVKRFPFAVDYGPFGEIEVEADAQVGERFCGDDSFFGGGVAHHQAGAGDDAVLMSMEDAAVDA